MTKKNQGREEANQKNEAKETHSQIVKMNTEITEIMHNNKYGPSQLKKDAAKTNIESEEDQQGSLFIVRSSFNQKSSFTSGTLFNYSD